MKNPFYRVSENHIIKINRIVSIKKNKKDDNGWIRYDDGDNRVQNIPINLGQYVELCEIIFSDKPIIKQEEGAPF